MRNFLQVNRAHAAEKNFYFNSNDSLVTLTSPNQTSVKKPIDFWLRKGRRAGSTGRPRMSSTMIQQLVCANQTSETLPRDYRTGTISSLFRNLTLLFAVLVMSIANIGMAWGANFTPAQIVAGASSGNIQVSTSVANTGTAKLCTSQTSVADVPISTAANGDYNAHYIEIKATSGTVSSLSVKMRGNSDGSSAPIVAVFWNGDASGTFNSKSEPNFINRNTADCDAVVNITVPSGTKTVRLYRQIKVSSSNQTTFASSNTTSFPSSGNTFHVFGITATAAGGCSEITPTFSTDYASTTLTVGEGNSSTPAINKDGSSGAITWTSSDDAVATVDENGVVTPVAAGSATITATVAEAGGKCEGSVSKNFTIVANPLGSHTITYTLSPINTADASLTSTQTSTSTYLKNLTTINASLCGFAGSPSKASNRTAKINRASSGKDNDKYIYFTFEVEDGYQFTPTAITIKVANVSNATTFDASLISSDGPSVGATGQSFASTDGTVETWTITNPGSTALTGTVTLKIWPYAASAGSFRFGTPITIDGTVAAAVTPACTAPNHVDISGRWDRFGGETISLTATAYSSAGTGSPIADGDITGWQWEKLIGSTWTALSNGTVDGVTTSGATTKNLQIANCGAGNSGKYRCVVSTGATCSTPSATATDGTEGFGVKVYVLECYNGGTTEHHFTRTGDTQAGTLTMTLSANTAYTFKVHADNTYYGNSGTIDKDETNWVMCNSDNGASCGNLTVNSGLGGTFTFGIEYSTSGNSSEEGEPEISVTYPRKTIYVQCGAWKNDGDKIAVYYWRGGTNGWTDFMIAEACDDNIRSTEIPAWAEYITFARFASSKASTGNWDDKHNQSNNITPSATNDLYVFSGNWNGCDGNSCFTNTTSYSPTTYTISFADGGGTGSMSAIENLCPGDDPVLPANTFTRTGYTFNGWKTNVAITANSAAVAADGAVAAGATINDIATDITLTAQWTPIQYDVTLEKGSAAAAPAGNSGSAKVYYDAATLTNITHATWTGHVLTGYYTSNTGGTKVLNEDGTFAASTVSGYITDNKWTRAENTTLKAQWTCAALALVLDGDPATPAGGSPIGTEYTLTCSASTGAIASYQWKQNTTASTTGAVNAQGTGATTASFNPVPAAAGTYYYYCVATDDCGNSVNTSFSGAFTFNAATYSITYNCDGADSGCPSNVASATNLPNPLPDAPVKAGYVFDGWYTNSAKTDAAVAGATLTGNITLYAKWIVNEGCEDLFVGRATSTTVFAASVGSVATSLQEGASFSTGGYSYCVKPNSSSAVVATPKTGKSFAAGDSLIFVVYNPNGSSKTMGFTLGSGTTSTSVAANTLHIFRKKLVAADIAGGKVTFNRQSSDDRWVAITIKHCDEGPTITATKTSPDYVSPDPNNVVLSISTTGASAGWYYRVKNTGNGGYQTPDNTPYNTTTWTMTSGLSLGANNFVVELYNGSGVKQAESGTITVTAETAYPITITAGAGGSVSPSGEIKANESGNHIHPAITATPSSGYHFVNWTYSNANATVADASAASTTISNATGDCTITANFEADASEVTVEWGNCASPAVSFPTSGSSEIDGIILTPSASLNTLSYVYVGGSDNYNTYNLNVSGKYVDITLSSGVISSVQFAVWTANNTLLKLQFCKESTYTGDPSDLIGEPQVMHDPAQAGSGLQTINAPANAKSARIYKDGSDHWQCYLYCLKVTSSAGCASPHTLSFAAGGATGSLPGSRDLCEGTEITLPDAGALAKAGNTFAGWSDGVNTYAAGASYTMPGTDKALTAQWTPFVVPTVTNLEIDPSSTSTSVVLNWNIPGICDLSKPVTPLVQQTGTTTSAAYSSVNDDVTVVGTMPQYEQFGVGFTIPAATGIEWISYDFKGSLGSGDHIWGGASDGTYVYWQFADPMSDSKIPTSSWQNSGHDVVDRGYWNATGFVTNPLTQSCTQIAIYGNTAISGGSSGTFNVRNVRYHTAGMIDIDHVVLMRKEGSAASSPSDGAATQLYSGKASHYTDSPVSASTTYYYTIFAVHADGTLSAGVTVMREAVCTDPVEEATVTAKTHNSATITLEEEARAYGYSIKLTSASGAGTFDWTYDDLNTYILEGLTPSTEYTFHVKAYNAGRSCLSAEYTISFTTNAAPAYTVTYNYNGATSGASPANATGASVTLPTPTRTGYELQGWYATDGTKAGDGGDTYNPAADITLYAKWYATCAAGSSTDVYNGENVAKGSTTASGWTINSSSKMALQSGSASGYSYWYQASSNSSDDVQFDGSASLASGDQIIIQWTHTSGNKDLQLKINDSSASLTSGGHVTTANTLMEAVYDVASALSLSSIKLNSSGSSGCRIFQVTLVTASGGTCYHVTYDGNGATSGFVNDTTAYKSGDEVTVLGNGGRYPYVNGVLAIKGWADTKVKADAGTVDYAPGATFTITADKTLYAVWSNEHPITYHLNGASWADEYTAPAQYTYGTGATLPIASEMSNPGYTFNGWYANSDLSTGGVVTTIGTSEYGAKEFWAKWTENTYTVTYNANGGTGSMETTVGRYVYLRENTFTYAGHIFMGWNTAANGSGISYNDEDEVELTADMTLYAQWGSTLSATWSVTKIDSKLYRGGGGYSVTVYLNQADWDASGDVTALELTATEGVVLSNITKTVNGEGQAQVTANFGITTGVAADATEITFTLSVPAAGTYASVELPHNETLDDCGGSGCATWEGTPSSWTDGSLTADSKLVLVADPNDASKTAIGSARISTNPSNLNKTCITINSSDKYVTGYFNDYSVIPSLFIGASSNQDNENGLVVVLFSPNADFSSSVTCQTCTAPSLNTAYDESTLIHEFTPPVGTKYFRIYRKINQGVTIGDYTSPSGGIGNQTLRIFKISACSSGGGVETSLTWTPTLASDEDWDSENSRLHKENGDADFTFTATTTSNSLGTITYSSSNTSVATVSSAGKVHIAGIGDATITATLAASGCYDKATTTYNIHVTSDCDDVAGTISTSDAGCAGTEMTITGHTAADGVAYQWYKDDVAIPSANSSSYTTAEAGEYYVIVTNTGSRHCAMASQNTITIEAKASLSISNIIHSWYVKNGRRTPDIALVQSAGATDFTVKVGSTPIWKSDGSVSTGFGGCGFYLGEDGIIYLKGSTNAGAAPSGLTGSTDVVLTISVTDACGGGESTAEDITIHCQAATERKSIAFVVDGTDGGTFAEANAAHSTNSALFKFLDYGDDSKGAFDLTAQNIYSTTNEKAIREHFSQFDAILITDDPSTKTKGYVNAFGTMIDVRPILSMEAYVSNLSNWGSKGVAGNPSSPNPRQYEMRLQCKDHEIYSGLPAPAAGTHVWSETIDGEEYRHVIMVDSTKSPYAGVAYNEQTAGDKKPALQGFESEDMGNLLGLGLILNGTLHAGVERQEEPAARMMLLGIQNQALPNALTEEGKKVIENALKYLLKTNMEEVDDCSNFFKGGDPTKPKDWNTLANWSKATFPNYETKVRILAPCEVSGIHVRVAQVDIATSGTSSKIDGGTCNGSLTIAADGALIVGGKVRTAEAPRFAVNELKPTTASDLKVCSSSSGTGALIFDNSDGKTQATVEMWNPSHWETVEGKKKKYWSYVGVPIANVEIPNYFYLGFTYLYDETSGWVKKWDGDVLQPFEGIGLSMQSGNKETFYGTLASTATKEITLTKTAEGGNGENLIGNSWTAPIQIANFRTADFGEATATVYVYNTGRDEEVSGEQGTASYGGNNSATAGQWVSVPISAAKLDGYTGLKVIPAMNAFQVTTSSETTLTLDYDSLVRKNATSNEGINSPMRAPRRAASKAIDALMRVRVSGEKTHTDVWLLQDEQFSEDFDNGWEAIYAVCDNRSAQLYAVSELGQMAFIAKPDLDGTLLGFAPSRDGNEYTFSFQYTGDEALYLNDMQEETSTLINEENTYMFTYSESDMAGRFIISAQPFGIPAIITGNENINTDAKPIKFIKENKMFILVNGVLYDATGKIVVR